MKTNTSIFAAALLLSACAGDTFAQLTTRDAQSALNLLGTLSSVATQAGGGAAQTRPAPAQFAQNSQAPVETPNTYAQGDVVPTSAATVKKLSGPMEIEPAPNLKNLNLASGGANLSLWDGLEANQSPVATMDDVAETFSQENIKTNEDIRKTFYGRPRFHRWEGYIEIKKSDVYKFNLKRVGSGYPLEFPASSLLINDIPVITMKSEVATKGTAAKSELVSLTEGYYKITINFAVKWQNQEINVSYGPKDSTTERKIVPKGMIRVVSDDDF